MPRICVFTGSSPGARTEYALAAEQFGHELAARGYELVYGGGKVGLMGALADAVLASEGKVIGVIPKVLLAKEVAHGHLTELRVVASMHERKAMMADLADAFVALPGGLGTLEELCEILTWAQLGLHAKPCGLLNVCNYFDELLAFVDHAVSERFVKSEHRALLLTAQTASELFERLTAFRPRPVEKWIDRASS